MVRDNEKVDYLNLHRERATFCAIDLTTDEGFERIQKAINNLTEILFSYVERRDTIKDVAERMRAHGIDEQTIKECLQL